MRRDPQIFAKRKEVQRIEAEREEMLRKHAEEIDASSPTQEELARKLARLRDPALPLADQRVRLQMASYQAGRADLGAVLAARRDQVETRLKVHRYAKRLWMRCARARLPLRGAPVMSARPMSAGCRAAPPCWWPAPQRAIGIATWRAHQAMHRDSAADHDSGHGRRTQRQSAIARCCTGTTRCIPQQKFDKPGKSPFMDMQLVPKYADEERRQA